MKNVLKTLKLHIPSEFRTARSGKNLGYDFECPPTSRDNLSVSIFESLNVFAYKRIGTNRFPCLTFYSSFYEWRLSIGEVEALAILC